MWTADGRTDIAMTIPRRTTAVTEGVIKSRASRIPAYLEVPVACIPSLCSVKSLPSTLDLLPASLHIQCTMHQGGGGGGCSSISGIYGCATLMGGFVKKFASMMGVFFQVLASQHLSWVPFLEILPLLGKKWPFSFKMTKFLPIMGGFSADFAPMRELALQGTHE